MTSIYVGCGVISSKLYSLMEADRKVHVACYARERERQKFKKGLKNYSRF
jgi:hypothetical protein